MLAKALRRCTRRYCSQREQFYRFAFRCIEPFPYATHLTK
jgi:hypothetical protein